MILVGDREESRPEHGPVLEVEGPVGLIRDLSHQLRIGRPPRIHKPERVDPVVHLGPHGTVLLTVRGPEGIVAVRHPDEGLCEGAAVHLRRNPPRRHHVVGGALGDQLMDEPQAALRARGQVALNYTHDPLIFSGDLSMGSPITAPMKPLCPSRHEYAHHRILILWHRGLTRHISCQVGLL